MVADKQQPLYFSWYDQDQCIGLAVGVESRSRIPLAGRFIKHLNFESYPSVKNNSSQLSQKILEQLLGYAQKAGYLTLSVNSFMTDTEIEDVEQMGFIPSLRIEFTIDLTNSDDELFNQLATRHKRKTKKARKHNLILREAESMEAMREFRKLQIQSRDRRMQRGEFIGMLDDSYYETLAQNYFKERLGRVFLMMHEDQAVSAAFVSIFGGKAYYVYGGSSDEGFKMNAPPLLFLNIFSRCRELGCQEFNMGGVPATSTDPSAQSHGLYLFKAGFGGREIRCASLRADNLQPGLNALVRLVKRIKS